MAQNKQINKQMRRLSVKELRELIKEEINKKTDYLLKFIERNRRKINKIEENE